MFGVLQNTGLPIETGSGGRTKVNRARLGLPKAHWIDAACIGQSGESVHVKAGVETAVDSGMRAWHAPNVRHRQVRSADPAPYTPKAALRFSNRRHRARWRAQREKGRSISRPGAVPRQGQFRYSNPEEAYWWYFLSLLRTGSSGGWICLPIRREAGASPPHG